MLFAYYFGLGNVPPDRRAKIDRLPIARPGSLECFRVLVHIVMTRFNLPTPGRESAHRARSGWLAERFDLFERYCLPAMAAQAEQDFAWLVFFDEATPAWARERIEAARRQREFQPVYTGLFPAEGWARAVRERIGPPVTGRRIITSNLDNDDALGIDALARVRRAAESHDPGARFAVNLPDGFVLAGDSLFAHRHLHNAFTHLIEPDDDRLATTMTIRHMDLFRHVPVIQAEGPGAWLQVVHGGNVSNKVRGRRVSRAEAARSFPAGIVAEVRDPGPVAALFESLLLAPARALRDRAFALARRIVPADRPG